LPARHVCAREVVESTAGQYSVMILVARILLVQKVDAAGFVWTLTGIKVCPQYAARISSLRSYLRCDYSILRGVFLFTAAQCKFSRCSEMEPTLGTDKGRS